MSWKQRVLVPVVCLAAACGGSGGDGPSISGANAATVAGQGLEAVAVLERMCDAVEALTGALDPAAPPPTCAAGSATSSQVDAAPAGLSRNDFVTLGFVGCVLDVQGTPVTVDGAVLLTATNVAGTVPVAPYTLEVDAQLQGLMLDDAGAAVVLDGGFRHELVVAGTGATSTAVQSTSLDASAGGATLRFTDLDFARGSDPGSGAYSFEIDGTFSSSVLGGQVLLDTRIAFTGVGASNPSAGRLDVVAPNGTRVRLDVLDAVNIQLRVDADGDGGFETTINTTWAALAG